MSEKLNSNENNDNCNTEKSIEKIIKYDHIYISKKRY